MKLKNIHVFLLLLGILLLSNLGVILRENFEVSRQNIPKGEEDLYILKSEIVPPVCPKCPDVKVCPDKSGECPACPPCGRCPQPAFECKKVPNYSSAASAEFLPRPVLSNFSKFGE